MLRYLRELAWPPGPMLVSAWNRSVGLIGSLASLLALFNRELASRVLNWDGFSPWWALLPAGLFVTYALFRAAYEKHQQATSDLQAALAIVAAERDEARRCVQSQAEAHSAAILKITGPPKKPVVRYESQRREVQQFKRAVALLLQRAPPPDVHPSLEEEWIASARDLLEELQNFRDRVLLPPAANVMFEHPKGLGTRKLDETRSSGFKNAFASLALRELSLHEVDQALAKEE